MADNMVLTFIMPESTDVETFDVDTDIWDETDDTKTTAWRYTSDSVRSSVMAFQGDCFTFGDGVLFGDGYYFGDSDEGKGEGVYKDFTVTAGTKVAFSALVRMENGAMQCIIYDQTNLAQIAYEDRTNTTWDTDVADQLSTILNYFTVPDGCTTVRIKFIQNASTRKAGPYLVDNVAFNEKALTVEPDRYRRRPQHVGAFHQALSGKRIFDLTAIHYSFLLSWNYLEEDYVETLRQMFFSTDTVYLDDGDVPQLTEEGTVYQNSTFTFSGITNPSVTSKAYTAYSTNLPSAYDDFEDTEYATADYEAIDADDSNYKETSNPGTNNYLYHKFLLLSNISTSDVQRFKVTVVSSSNDYSTANEDGVILYAWDGTNWVELDQSTSDIKTDLTYSTTESEIAQKFVASDNLIRLLIRSRKAMESGKYLTLRTYYVEVEINEGLGFRINLTHLIGGEDITDGIVWVKNLTQGTTLSLVTDYVPAGDLRSIRVIGQSAGDRIQVKYKRFFEVKFADMPEDWYGGDPASDRNRAVNIVLQTITEET